MLKWIGGLMDRICAVAGAVMCAQLPLFMQQYTQQLVGREAELRMQVDAMRRAAALSGKSLEQVIQKFVSNSDPDIIHQGDVMLGLVQRWHSLTDALTAMQGSAVWERPFAFLTHLNAEAFKSTLKNFSMGIPMDSEGAIYALAGILLGYLCFAAVRKATMRIIGFERSKKPQEKTKAPA